MKLLKTLSAIFCAIALLTLQARADDKPIKSDSATTTKKTCCQEAKAKGKECTHKCCVAAHKEGKSCKHCNPNGEDLKKTAGKYDQKAVTADKKADTKQ